MPNPIEKPEDTQKTDTNKPSTPPPSKEEFVKEMETPSVKSEEKQSFSQYEKFLIKKGFTPEQAKKFVLRLQNFAVSQIRTMLEKETEAMKKAWEEED